MIETLKKNSNAIILVIIGATLVYIFSTFEWPTIKENIGFLSPLIIPFGLAFVNSKLKNQELKNQQKIEERDKIRDDKFNQERDAILSAVMRRLDGVDLSIGAFEKVVDELKKLFTDHACKDDFIDKFSTAIRGRSNSILIATKRCEQNFKTVLSSWTELVILFGIMYYKDKNRFEDVTEFKEYLEQEMSSKIDLFYSSCDLNVMGMRKHDGKEIRFSKLLKTAQIHNRTDFLISQLSDNGFKKQEDIIGTFRKYIKDFFELYFTSVTVWELCEKRKLTDAA
jgi:hypothetical protein